MDTIGKSRYAIKEQIGYEAVMGISERRVDGEINWNDIKRSDTIGTDEISLKKGHKDFVTVVTSINEGQTEILAVLKGREKITVKIFFQVYRNCYG